MTTWVERHANHCYVARGIRDLRVNKISLRELESLRVALTEWRALLQKRYGWRTADSAYVRHGAILSAALMGSEV